MESSFSAAPATDLSGLHVGSKVRHDRFGEGEIVSIEGEGAYVRQVIENLEPAMALPGGVYNFGSGNAENMVCTARQFAETLGIAVQIEEESWSRNLVMDTTKLERFGIRFDTTQQGIQRCFKDYGLRML